MTRPIPTADPAVLAALRPLVAEAGAAFRADWRYAEQIARAHHGLNARSEVALRVQEARRAQQQPE